MIGICRAELRKLTARPAILVCAGLLLVGIVLLFYVLPDITFSSPGYHSSGGRSGAESRAQDLYPAAFLTRLVILFSVGAGMLALLVGTLSAGSEYGWDTLKTVYTQGPGRLPLFLGQVVAAALVLTAVLVLTAALAALSSLVVVTMDGKTATWPAGIDVLKTLGAIWLVLVCYLAIGMTLATLLRNPALAIGGALAYYLVFELAFVNFVGILYGSSAGDTLSKVLPGGSAHALLVSFMPFSPGDVVVIQDDHAIVVLMLWSVVCVAASAALVWRRDVV